MRVFELLRDHQGYAKGTQFQGPSEIEKSDTMGYFPLGSDPINQSMCFFQSYVEGNPNLFEEIKTSTNNV